jgi:acetylornithine deacetylase/succinyl-diaminopimelate desuccinylase-like protein
MTPPGGASSGHKKGATVATTTDVDVTRTELDELVELLRSLIRIPSVNPQLPEAPDGELRVARFLEDVLVAEGIPATVVEPFPGRGSIVARLRGDGTGGDPLLLLSHLDVVPAVAGGWTHDPFGADLESGFVYGRGAVDMKSMVALEVQAMRRLARAARAAGLDPASDPIPGLRRDVIFACTADEEAGGHQGAGWVVEHHPEWLRAAAALNESGGLVMRYGNARFRPIQVAEKGFVVYRIHVHGRWGHGSVPTADNAAVIAAQIITRLAEPGPVRLTAAMATALRTVTPHLDAAVLARLETVIAPERALDGAALDEAFRAMCDPVMARTISAVIRDTVSIGIVNAGVKYNVIPGVADMEIDCRILPGTDEPAMRAELRRRIGEELWARMDVECEMVGLPAEAPIGGAMYPLLEQIVRDHDPEAVPLPFLAPFATDAKHLAKIGVPVYGFSPLDMAVGDFMAWMHADDERVGVEALRSALPILWDVVTRFCR